VNGSTVTLTWTASAGATSYRIDAGSAAGRNDILSSNLGSIATALTASNVNPGTYFVRISALNACGTSGPSNDVVVAVR
jgi:hypothetical protein